MAEGNAEHLGDDGGDSDVTLIIWAPSSPRATANGEDALEVQRRESPIRYPGSQMSDTSVRLLASVIEDIEPSRYRSSLRADDLPYGQRVEHYDNESAQKRYVHMYAAKHIGMWSALRRMLNWDDRVENPLYSIGAGPLLDLLGWCFHVRWKGEVYAVDPLSWSAVRNIPNWKKVVRELVGTVHEKNGVYIPGPKRPKQLASLPTLNYLSGSNLKCGSVVLMPFVLNHLLENDKVPPEQAQAMASWIEKALKNDCRIVIVDMSTTSVDCWQPLLEASNQNITPYDCSFEVDIARFSELYPSAEVGQHRTGQNFHKFTVARVLAIDESGWRFVCDE